MGCNMKKNMHIKLVNDNNIILEEDLIYLSNNNTITFFIDNIKNTINLNEQLFIRENEEYTFTLDILNKKSTLLLKKENYLLHLKVDYAILLTNQNNYEISYHLESQENDTLIILELEGE